MRPRSVLIFSGSPRKGGNSDLLADSFLDGAELAGAATEKIFLYKSDVGPCIECGSCDKNGECVLEDDMAAIYPKIENADVIVVSSPIFFYNITSRTQALVERSQALWVRKYVLKNIQPDRKRPKGVFLSVGATKGKLLFDGVIRVMRYFFDALDAEFTAALLIRGVEKRGDIKRHPFAIKRAGELAEALVSARDISDIPDIWMPGMKISA